MSLPPKWKFSIEHNNIQAHCLCRPSALRLNLIIIMNGESYVALNRLSTPFPYLWRITPRSILHLDTLTHPVRARRQLGTGDVRSKQKEAAWHRLRLIKSASREEQRRDRAEINDTSLAALDGDDLQGTNQAHNKQKANIIRDRSSFCGRQKALICISLMSASSQGDGGCFIPLISTENHLYWT